MAGPFKSSRASQLDPFSEEGLRYGSGRSGAIAQSTGFASTVYTWMAIGLGLTTLATTTLGTSQGFIDWMVAHNGFKFLPWILLGYSLLLQFGIRSIPTSLATLGFFGYAALMGVALAPIMVIYTGASLATTFGVAAGMFGSMAVVGNLTKRDLTSMGSMLGMATWGLMLAMLANMWFKSGTTDLIISGFGVVIFTGLSAYDAQRIKRIQESGVEGDDAARLAVLCALHMYMNVCQIFLFLLRFLGNRRER